MYSKGKHEGNNLWPTRTKEKVTYEDQKIDRAEKALLYKYRQCTLCEIAMFANFKYMYHVSRCRNKLIITTERFIYWMKQIYSALVLIEIHK